MRHRKHFMLTAWHIFAIATLVASFAFVGTMLCWTLQGFDKPVVEFPKGLNFEQYEVKAGDSVTLEAGYCKNVQTSSTSIARSFQDELTYYLPVQQSNVSVGCNLNYKTVISIPENLPPDVYTYNMTITYQVNPIKTVQYTFESNTIKVIRKD